MIFREAILSFGISSNSKYGAKCKLKTEAKQKLNKTKIKVD